MDFANKNMLGYEGSPDIIVTHRFSPFNDNGGRWLETLGDPVAKVFGYTIYANSDNASLPSPKDVLIDAEIYRFSLEKWVSLTWY